MEADTIKPGMKVMISGFGVGLSWGGTIINLKKILYEYPNSRRHWRNKLCSRK